MFFKVKNIKIYLSEGGEVEFTTVGKSIDSKGIGDIATLKKAWHQVLLYAKAKGIKRLWCEIYKDNRFNQRKKVYSRAGWYSSQYEYEMFYDIK